MMPPIWYTAIRNWVISNLVEFRKTNEKSRLKKKMELSSIGIAPFFYWDVGGALH